MKHMHMKACHSLKHFFLLELIICPYIISTQILKNTEVISF